MPRSPSRFFFGPVSPGDKGDIGEERNMTKPAENKPSGQGVIRLGNVSKPMITVFRPAADKANGAAVVVCPGGGYNILAYDLEGTEVCQWLNSHRRDGRAAEVSRAGPRRRSACTAPLQDAQRAIGLVRARGRKIGASTRSASASSASPPAATSRPWPAPAMSQRTYGTVDAADSEAAAPISRSSFIRPI